MAPSGSSTVNTETYQPNWHIRAITAPGPDSDLSLHVSFDNARFLFGCGEGTQRAFTQKRLTMRGLSGIFIGSGESRGRAGLAGVLMTAADAGIAKVDIVGPPDISHFLATLRSSVVRDSINVQMHAFPRIAPDDEAVEMFKSPNVTVRAISLVPSSSADQLSDSHGGGSSSYLRYEPHSHNFRPSRLSPTDTQKWCDQVVSDMFQNGSQVRSFRRASSPHRSPTRPMNPLLNPDGSLNAARSDTRMPLPLPSRMDVETQMVYICQAPDVRGKFDVGKANALGVPKGPLRGHLTRGENIEVVDPTAEGGKRVVRPEDCLVGGGPGSVLIVINCTEATMPSLLANRTLEEYQELQSQPEGRIARHVHMIVHRVPKTVWQKPEYQAWMTSFGNRTQHLIADPDNSPDHTVFNSAAWNTLQLSLLDSEIFTPPYIASSTPEPSSPLPPNTNFLVQGSYCRMHPPSPASILPHHEKDVPFLVIAAEGDVARETILSDMPEYAQACNAAQAAVRADPRSGTPPASQAGDDIVVTTLGTGSAIPSKYRNVSATHLSIPGLGGILLDCGEGTLGQLRRRYGKDNVKNMWKELKMIFISHMHADHHLGLNVLLEDRFKHGITDPLYIIAPPFIALNMQESASWQYHAPSRAALENVIYININRLGSQIENEGYNEPVPSSPEVTESRAIEYFERETMEDGTRGVKRWPFVNVHGFSPSVHRGHGISLSRLMMGLDLKSIWAPTVQHRGKAFGLALEHQSGWKIVYSGDTKPCQSLVEAGKNATLLIHEATLEDDKPEVAAAKGHSTFSQAIDIGKQMNARHILLNHFSQRYPKLPKLPTPAPIIEVGKVVGQQDIAPRPVVSISFDFMSIKIGDMWKMAYYMEPLSLLFAEAEEEGEGEDRVVGAVEGDVNPTLDGSEVVGGKNKNKTKSKNGDEKSKPMPGQGNGVEGKKAKRSMKKEAARAANKPNGTGNEILNGKRSDGSGDGFSEKRAGSPTLVEPEAKRRSADGGVERTT
ncbi:hypothetical protein IAR55_006753 [Kwoniella newhampshirensis]|uniref:ribonuclease Z n=1 Tax=Kwoniella newhampshirensis TaxID=1651941 RepID=A0AAW0YSR0_9TREE